MFNTTFPSGSQTGYIHDLANHIIAETNGAGVTLREYIWAGDMPVAVVDKVNTTPVVYHVHTDHLMRPIRMTDNAGTVVWSAAIRPLVWQPLRR